MANRTDIASWYKSLPHKSRFIVVTGAGISQSANIPTFSGANGIFKHLEGLHSQIYNGADVFDWNTCIGRKSEIHLAIYLQRCASLRLQSLKLLAHTTAPTGFHQWIKRKSEEKKIGLHLTFNIDCLETHGLSTSSDSVFQAHGSLSTLKCEACSFETSFSARHARRILRSSDGKIYHEDCYSSTRRSKRKSVRNNWFRPTVVMYGSDPNAEALSGASITKFSKQLRNMMKNPSEHFVLILAGLSLRTAEVRSLIGDISHMIRSCGGDIIWVNPGVAPSCIRPILTLCGPAMSADEFVDIIDAPTL